MFLSRSLRSEASGWGARLEKASVVPVSPRGSSGNLVSQAHAHIQGLARPFGGLTLPLLLLDTLCRGTWLGPGAPSTHQLEYRPERRLQRRGIGEEGGPLQPLRVFEDGHESSK